MSVIAIPKILRERLTDEGAEAFVEILNKSQESSKEHILEVSEERFEKRLAQVETRLIRWMFIFWVGQIGGITVYRRRVDRACIP